MARPNDWLGLGLLHALAHPFSFTTQLRSGTVPDTPYMSRDQVIEKSNEYNLPLCVGFINYEKAFDSVEHFAIFDALRKININETYVTILENTYRNASARVHIDYQESEPFPKHRGVGQEDPISPKLFTAAIEMIFRKADLEHGLNVDGETLTNLRFADDVALVRKSREHGGTTECAEQHHSRIRA
ncbi:endonuclease-reverse transcriptase [Plakobranchus ocellatus]|uniref:Endonuclease-reverse transcriptase n=1 Tax=Plakobranchus ocellatus TaxID=259542 RepID=A0AAV3XWR2_9GAST|nr:endonuclease-reverse transcriptase [Plakobranchus ocellatus]